MFIVRFRAYQYLFTIRPQGLKLSVPKDPKFLPLSKGDIVECVLKEDRWSFVRIRKDLEWPSFVKQHLMDKYGFYYTTGKATKCAGMEFWNFGT